MSIACLALTLVVFLLRIAYEHRGFFSYHYDILTSKEHASYQKELLDLIKENPPQAFQRFKEILQDTPIAHNTCHGIAHQTGHTAFETYGFQKAMAYQNGLCGGGYIHGIIEARFGLLQEKDLISQVPTICDAGNNSCYHGIGHGLMIATKLNIETSLSYCDLLTGVGKRNCYDGVWMHIFDLEETGIHEKIDSLAANDETLQTTMIAMCQNAKEAYKTSCYFYLPRVYAHVEEVSFDHYKTLCDRVEDAYKTVCAAGAGHSLMKYHIDNPPVTFGRCDNFPTADLVNACKEGGALYYLFDKETMTIIKPTRAELDQYCAAFTDEEDIKICKKVNMYRDSL